MTEQKQPKRWAEVVAKPEFQALEPMERERMRHQYFDEIVAPQTTAANYSQAWEEFDAHSQQILGQAFGAANPASSEPEGEGPGVFGNTGRRIADRASDLAGNLGIGIGKAAEAGGDFVAGVTGINPGVVWGEGQGLRFTMNMPDDVNDIGAAMQSQGEAVRDYDAGYQPNFTWERLKGDLSVGNLAGYIVEQGGGSIPDMIAAVTMLPAYIATRTEEVADERATNDGREAPGGRDYAVAAPTAVAMSVLERLGAKGILGEKEVGTAMDLLKETGRAAGKEAGTEFVQEGMEYTATTAGTETGYDPVTMLDRGAAGAVAGGGIGGVGRAATGGAEMAGIKQTEQGRQTRAEAARRAAEQADIDFEVKMRQLQEQMRGDFEPNAPRIEGAQAVPQADFYAGTDGTVTAEQQTQREMPQPGPEAQQQPQGFGIQREPAAEPQPSLEPQGITFEDWDDANDAITFDESDIEPEIANIAEMAEFAGMVGVPRQAIESALSLNNEQETISALEDMVATAQAEMNPPEVTPNAVDPRAESQNPEQAGQPEPALRDQPENRPEAAGIPRAPESGRTENEAQAPAEPATPVIATEAPPVDPAAPIVEAEQQALEAEPIVEHTTKKGKTLRGVVRDISQDEAKAIDPYTFRKDGGFFIREKHLDQAPVPSVEPESRAPSASSEPSTPTPSTPTPPETSDSNSRFDQEIRDKAAGFQGTYGDRSLAPVAQEIADHALTERRRLTGEEITALAEKHEVPESLITGLTGQPWAWDGIKGLAGVGNKQATEYLNQPKADPEGKSRAEIVREKAKARKASKDSKSISLTTAEAKESQRLDRQKKAAMARGDGDTVDTLDDKQEALRQRINARVSREQADNDIDTAANEAATSPTNDLPEPTEAQKEAGNYKKGHINIQGLDVSIENPKGSTRRGTDPDGNEWSVEMKAHYGDVRGTQGADGDAVDVFIGPNPESDQVFVVDQVNADGSFDEHKALIGWDTEQEARDAYAANYDDGWKVGPVTAMSMDEFKGWLESGDTRKPLNQKEQTRADRVREKAKARARKAKPSNNKVFTDEDAEKAREVLRRKLGQMNAGIDPEILQAGITLAGYHIEKGARTFSAFAKAMIEDMGEGVKPYLKSWYMGVKYDPRAADFGGMSTAAEVEDADIDTALSADDLSTEKAASTIEKEVEQSAQEEGRQNDTQGTERNAAGRNKTPRSRSVPSDESPESGRDLFGQPDGRVRSEQDGRNGPGNSRNSDSGQSRVSSRSNASDSGNEPAQKRSGNDRSESGDGADRRSDDYRIEPGELKREGSWFDTATRNVDIIELVKKFDDESRKATPEEQALLTKYTGWGASEVANGIFPNQYEQYKTPRWRELGERLKAALSDEEYAQARRTTQYAHYTSESVIRSIYDGLNRMGFAGGSVLEPGMGVGLFKGLMPPVMAGNSQYTGIEYDTMTGKIAGYLYPDSQIMIEDFTQVRLPKDFYDAAIGNPPFSRTKVTNDPEYRKQSFMLHDYFFAKTIDRVKPGGLVVFVTSKGTMDKGTQKARQFMADRANLVGAVRLPQTAFKQNAGTEVVTDVLFFQKRGPGIEDNGIAWLGTKEVKTPQGNTAINEYFADHPDMVLGDHALTGSMYRSDEYTVIPREGQDIEQAFASAVEQLPQGIYRPERGSRQEKAAVLDRDFNPFHKKEGGIYLDDKGNLRQVESGSGVAMETRINASGKEVPLTDKQKAWLKDYVGLRDALKQSQIDQLTDGKWEASLKALNKTYDAFVKRHGRILAHSVSERENANGSVTVTRRFKNSALLDIDVESPLVYAIEEIKTDGSIDKAPALKSRTLKKDKVPQINTTQDALFVSLNQIGRLNIENVAELANITPKEVIEELGDLIYEDPTDGWTMADAYLSGDVVRKLKEARTAARNNRKLERNVKALEAVQPRKLAPKDITANLGAHWLPASDIANFAAEVMDAKVDVSYSPIAAAWEASGGRKEPGEWSTSDRSVGQILDSVLNNRQLKITYRDAEGKTYTDDVATENANNVAKKMRDEFKKWIWSDEKRTDRLVKFYNEHFNNIVPREFNGDHLTLPGVSTRFNLYSHQKRAIWRGIQEGNTYLAHSVGAGKTFTMIATGMEERRLGLSRKPMYVVPNHMLAQFSNEFLELYPTANIMVADENNFKAIRRRRFMAQAALNDPDAIILTHSAFGMIPVSDEYNDKFINEQIEDLRQVLEESKDDRLTTKKLEQQIEQMESRLRGKSSKEKKDQALDFEAMGVDRMFIDEAHEFRKLDFATNRGNIKGIDSTGSKKALDLYMKVSYLEEQNPGRSLVMASGTPVTNTMGELYTVQRFFQKDQLEADGLARFDAWSNHFGEVVDGFEQNAAGGYQIVSRFAKFVNIADLMSRVRTFMDVLTSDQLGDLVQRPAVSGGAREIIATPVPDGYKAYQKSLEDRIKDIKQRRGPPSPGDDIILNVIADGRFSAIDMRFVDPTLPSDPNSKLNKLLDDVIAAYNDTASFEYSTEGKKDANSGSSLMVFTDLGLGEASAQNRGFDMKAWMRKRLVEGGVDPKHIAFMRDNKQHAKKERLFNDMREGKKRILIGGKDMETGVNVQKRLSHLFHLDAPWFPAAVEQREGRIIRQGNQNKEVSVKAYATKGSYDSTMWGMLARKARFIEQAVSGDANMRAMDDVSEASSFEMASALASGDERYLKLAGLRADVDRLHRLYSAHNTEMSRLDSEQRSLRSSLTGHQKTVAQIEKALPKRKPIKSGEFNGTVGKKTFDSREEFSEAIFNEFNDLANSHEAEQKAIASLGGFDVVYTGMTMRGSGDFVASLDVAIPGDPEPLAVYPTDPAMSVTGIATRAVNQVNRLDRQLDETRERIDQVTRRLEQIESRKNAPFAELSELTEKQNELNDLEAELAMESEEQSEPVEGAETRFSRAPATDTPAFKRWFGDSKVVDANGDPMVVYHGTDATFTEFSPDALGSNTAWENTSLGFYFIADRSLAKDFAEQSGGDVVMESYLSIQKPLNLTTQELFNNDAQAATIYEAMTGERLSNAEALDAINEEIELGEMTDAMNALATDEAKAIMERDGYDGVISEYGDGVLEYVAFNPSQIKSATDNQGTFNPENPDIRMSRAQPGDNVAAPDEKTKPKNTEGLSAKEVEEVAERLQEKLPGIVNVVQSMDELPERYRLMRQAGAKNGPRGFFDPETNEVFLIADNIKDSAEAERTYLHEVVGHFGIRLAYGNELNGYLDRLYKQIPASKLKPFMDRYGLKEHKATDRRVAVEEYIAHTAELNGRKPHWFKRLIARVRDWLRSVGVVKEWTNDDLYALIARSNNPTVDTMLAQSMASLSNLRRQMDSADDNVRLAMTDDGTVTAEEEADSALGMLYGFAYAGHTVYPVNPGATNAETLFRHYGYEGNIDADASVNVAGQYNPVSAVVGKTPGSGRAAFDFKIIDTESALPYAVMMPSAGARRGVALYQAAMDWAHNNYKKLRPDPAGLSPVNYLRRSEAMLASMMRNGTSRHLEPDYTQFSGFLDDSQYTPLAAGEYSPETNGLLKQFKDRLWGNEGQSSAGETVARANAHNMAAASLALTLRRKPELLNYRADSQGNIYEIPPNASAKPKRIAGPATAIREIQKTITVSDAANGVGARTALRAILAQSALLGPNGPRDIAGAISAITDSLALFHKGQVEKMPPRALLPDVVIRRMARAYSNEGSQQQRIYYSLKDPEKPRTVDDIINLKHQTPLARAVSWASKQGAGITSQKYGALTLRQLSEISRRTMPHIKAYVATIHRMMTRRNQMAEDAVTIASDVQKWAARNAAEADTLFDLMHEATLAEVDPAEPFVSRKDMLNDRVKVLTERIKNVGGEPAQSGRKKRLTDELADIKKQIKDEPRREINHNRLSPIWEKLSPAAKKHYKTMKAKYEQRHEIFMKLMEARIQNADIEQHVKRQMIAEMRYEFESNTLGGVYFPLARFGDYWVETNDENGERLFTTYESERDQKRVVKELTAAKMPVTSGKFLQGSGEVDGVSLGFVQEVMETIDSSNVNEQLSSELGDAVYQLYLQALPTRSMRKNFIHRKGVQGFHRDAIRTFADNMMKGSHQLARLEYQDELSDLMVDMKKAAQKGSNTAADLYNEMVRRHEWVMNPANSTVAQKLTSIGFIWMLGITPAAALVNTTQNMVVALPVLASKFGWAAASKELVKTSGEFLGSIPGAVTDRVKGEKAGRPWSIRNALQGAEREAYDELVDLGVIDVTMAHNLAGIAETDAYRYSDTGHKVMSVVSYLFHKAEVYNRETSGIAAYRLAKASGMEHPKAVQYAADAVWDAHFDYTNTNRARFMQPNWAKVAFQFKQYSQNITYYLVRNAKRAMYDPALGMFGKVADTSKEEQREAAVQLAGTLGITLGLGGLTTMPMIGVINSLTNMLLDDDEDEPFDAETEVKQWIVDKVGQDLGERIIWGAGGAGLSSRVTLDGLWVRDPYRDMMGEDLWTHYAQQAMGPVIGGVFVSAFRGVQDISEGRPWTGVEKFLPKAFKDVSKAVRYHTEGATTRQGYQLKEDWTFGELALQGLGIADHDLMKRYDANSAIRSYDIAVANRKSALLNQYYQAYSEGDDALRKETMTAIRRFNDKNPNHKITRASIQSSIRTQVRNSRTNEAGMRMDRGLKSIKDRITYGD